MAKFTATHGVQLADLDIAFTFDAEATGSGQEKVYSTDVTAAAAKKLEAIPAAELARYGIKKAKADDKSADAPDAPDAD